MSDVTTADPTRDRIDLARADLGGMVIAANDEFFAAKENLILPAPPRFDPDAYYDRGKWMDGWETRRRRKPGYDWAVVRLATAGIVERAVIDTSYFTGNYPPHASLEGAYVPGWPSVDEVLADEVEWVPLLGRVALDGDAKNAFDIPTDIAVTHLRLNIFPDGGVARLRAHGRPLPAWGRLGAEPDLASVLVGGRVLRVSDEFYGVRHNLLTPGRALHMRDGWEVRRRRDDGHDWCLIRLGAPGTPRRVEIDTNHFKGNCPDTVLLEAAAWPDDPPADLSAIPWRTLLPRFRVQPHTRHMLVPELLDVGTVDLVRLSIFPDGGVSRLRIWGPVDRAARAAQGVERLDRLPRGAAQRLLTDCCGAKRWVAAMLEARPFGTPEAVFAAADAAWSTMTKADILEAFSHHPRIGERRVAAQSDAAAAWSRAEQSSTSRASQETLDRLAALNRAYEKRFGHTYIVFASGRSTDEMLALLEERLRNAPDQELAVAAAEQHRITRHRLDKLLSDGG